MNHEIIFYDTEFTHLDIDKGELLSIGLVKQSGEELYIEFEYNETTVHPWVTENVLPYLHGDTISYENAREKKWDFVGRDNKYKPFFMAYVNQFDAIYWYKLFEDPQNHPAFWIPLDFASILFAHGLRPDSMADVHFFESINIDKSVYNVHNALDDARMLKDVYEAFVQKYH